MTAIVKCYDRLGNYLDVLNNAQLGTRSWVSNRIGDFDFRLPRTDPKATKVNLGKMNLIQVESDTGVSDWGGRIKEVIWENPTYIYAKCESKEALLRRRNVNLSYAVSGITAGGIVFQTFMQERNSPEGIPGISYGHINSSEGETGSFEIYDMDLWDDVIQDMLQFVDDRREKAYVWVEADGKFYWELTRGEDRSATVILRSGYHILKWPRYRIDYSSIITQAIGLSNQASWYNKHRMPQRNIPAWSEWGTLEKSVLGKLCTSAACAEKQARMEIRKYYAPVEMLDIQINNRDGIWADFWIGDTVRVSVPNFGWAEEGGCDVKLKIQGIEIQEKPEKMRIIGSVVLLPAQESWSTF